MFHQYAQLLHVQPPQPVKHRQGAANKRFSIHRKSKIPGRLNDHGQQSKPTAPVKVSTHTDTQRVNRSRTIKWKSLPQSMDHKEEQQATGNNRSFPKPKLITSNSRPFPRPKLNLLNRTAKKNICRAGPRPQSLHHRRA